MAKKIIKMCLNCGKRFYIPPCREWREKCCSSSCKKLLREYYKQKSLEKRKRNCKKCGNVFYPRQYQIKVGDGKYCSKECRNLETLKHLHSEESQKKRLKGVLLAIKEGRLVPLKGKDNPRYKGRWKEQTGYIKLKVDGNVVLEHRYLMEKHLGRSLTDDEVIHHKNHIKDDNRLENLEIMTRAEHLNEHKKDFKYKPRYSGNKLNRDEVFEIRESLDKGETVRELALKYDISETMVYYIKNNKSWK